MSIAIRPTRPGDLEQILELCAARPLDGRPSRGVTAEQRQKYRTDAYRNHAHLFGTLPALEGFLATEDDVAVGFMVVLTGLEESITGEPQAQIIDFAMRHGDPARVFAALLAESSAHPRKKRAQYLIVELGTDDPVNGPLFKDSGFIIESSRIAKRMDLRLTDEVRRAQETYRVRLGNKDHLMFIAWLSTVSGSNLVPAGRDIDPLVTKGRFVDAYLAANVVDNPDIRALIAERLSDTEPVGYLLLKFLQDEVSGEKLGYCYDIAVRPELFGSGVSQYLSHEGEKVFASEGVHVCIGDISAANARPLYYATRSLGYDVESQKWARKLS